MSEHGQDLEENLQALCRHDPDLARIYALTGPLPDRTRPGGVATLMQIVVQQQLSITSANAIWTRLAELAKWTPDGEIDAAAFLALPEEDLLGTGLGRAKTRYCRNIAEAVHGGSLDLGALAAASDAEAQTALVEIKGIGRWTAEIYLLFSLGRIDIWPANDVALQVAAQHLKARPARPTVLEMDELAEAWRPWRGVAARLLWQYYRILTGRADPSGSVVKRQNTAVGESE